MTGSYLQREMEIVEILNHSGVVRVFGIDEEDGPEELTLRNYEGVKFFFRILGGIEKLSLRDYLILGQSVKQGKFTSNELNIWEPIDFKTYEMT